jgi:hypothetical protein
MFTFGGKMPFSKDKNAQKKRFWLKYYILKTLCAYLGFTLEIFFHYICLTFNSLYYSAV